MAIANSCCCCISVAMGTYILGWLGIVINLIEITDFVWYRCLTNAILSPIFLIMFFND